MIKKGDSVIRLEKYSGLSWKNKSGIPIVYTVREVYLDRVTPELTLEERPSVDGLGKKTYIQYVVDRFEVVAPKEWTEVELIQTIGYAKHYD